MKLFIVSMRRSATCTKSRMADDEIPCFSGALRGNGAGLPFPAGQAEQAHSRTIAAMTRLIRFLPGIDLNVSAQARRGQAGRGNGTMPVWPGAGRARPSSRRSKRRRKTRPDALGED